MPGIPFQKFQIVPHVSLLMKFSVYPIWLIMTICDMARVLDNSKPSDRELSVCSPAWISGCQTARYGFTSSILGTDIAWAHERMTRSRFDGSIHE